MLGRLSILVVATAICVRIWCTHNMGQERVPSLLHEEYDFVIGRRAKAHSLSTVLHSWRWKCRCNVGGETK